MRKADVATLIEESIARLLGGEEGFKKTIDKLMEVHEGKVHFLPIKYRVLGGFLQSLNIKFGNFLETLVGNILASDEKISPQVISEMHKLKLATICEEKINSHIDHPPNKAVVEEDLEKLYDSIFKYQTSSKEKFDERILDVDVLIRDSGGKYYYIEVKYNDDHDTGKFQDINRKALKTYAGLVNEYNIRKREDFNLILYYFNPKKRYFPSPYLRDGVEVLRGKELFDKFNPLITYDEVDTKLVTIGEDLEGKFDEYREKIFNRVKERKEQKQLKLS